VACWEGIAHCFGLLLDATLGKLRPVQLQLKRNESTLVRIDFKRTFLLLASLQTRFDALSNFAIFLKEFSVHRSPNIRAWIRDDLLGQHSKTDCSFVERDIRSRGLHRRSWRRDRCPLKLSLKLDLRRNLLR